MTMCSGSILRTRLFRSSLATTLVPAKALHVCTTTLVKDKTTTSLQSVRIHQGRIPSLATVSGYYKSCISELRLVMLIRFRLASRAVYETFRFQLFSNTMAYPLFAAATTQIMPYLQVSCFAG